MNKFKDLMKLLPIVLLIPLIFFPYSCNAEPQGKLIIFHACSLTVPFARMEKVFEAKYPKVDVLREIGGSTNMARMISELHKPADIMASADFEVIDKTLIPNNADWNIRFATNQLVLCCAGI
jgi:molybdate/tungstate transport system substrate-binding protein